MRAQCCICADLFENSGHLNVAAVPCGHTFHEECLMRWLANSSTCPSCRKPVKKNQIIKRLFFDIREAEDETAADDPDTLHNQIGALKAQICSLGTLKRELTDVQDKLAASVASKEEVQEKLKRVEKDKGLLEWQLKHVGDENSSFRKELVQFDATKRKLQKLEKVQLMLDGTEEEVCEMVSHHKEGGSAATTQLSSMVVVVKREYQKALEDKRALRHENRDLNLQVILSQTKMADMKKELKNYHLQVKEFAKTVFDLERENNQNRRKVAHLRSALKRNKTEGSQSFIAAVHEESPNVAYTPPPPAQPVPPAPPQQASVIEERIPSPSTSSCDNNVKSGNSEKLQSKSRDCLSPDLFDDADGDDDDGGSINCNELRKEEKVISTSSRGGRSRDIPVVDPEQDKYDFYASAPSVLKMIRIPTAAEKFRAAKQRKIEREELSGPRIPFSKFSIMQKKVTGLSSSRPLSLLNPDAGLPSSRAYNGLGGSTKIEEPFETPLRRGPVQLRKKAVKKRSPLVSKPIPNQPKIKTCLPKTSSTPSASLSERSENRLSNDANSIDNLSPILFNTEKRSQNKQNLVNNMFAKSGKSVASNLKAKKATTSIRSTETVSLSDILMGDTFTLERPSNGIIDLT